MLLHRVSLRLLTAFPFMTVTWLSSLPSSPCSPWSTTHHHHPLFCTRYLTLTSSQDMCLAAPALPPIPAHAHLKSLSVSFMLTLVMG